MTEESQLFGPAPQKEPKVFGNVYNGRYHLPLLPGESGTRNGGDHVPGGVMRMTNLAGALEDTRALSVWEQGMTLIGLGLMPELYEELSLMVQQAQADGIDFALLRNYPELKQGLAGAHWDQKITDASIAGKARAAARASAAALRGTVRHAAWEHFIETGTLIGTQEVRESTLRTAALLNDAGLTVVPELTERVVRNTVLGASGRFDNILFEQATGRMFMADLKTKATPYFSMLSVDIQLAGYAYAENMLTRDGQGYEPGPMGNVQPDRGVIMHVPSDGSPARLETADIRRGWANAILASQVNAERAYGRSADRLGRMQWEPAPDPLDDGQGGRTFMIDGQRDEYWMDDPDSPMAGRD